MKLKVAVGLMLILFALYISILFIVGFVTQGR